MNFCKRLFFTLLLLSFCGVSQAACVVLLHGLARTSDSMNDMELALTMREFFVINDDYPSRDHTIEDLADIAIESALAKCPIGSEVNFVTHSLGGILVRQYLSNHDIPILNRVVMLGPPNQGSEVVDTLATVPGFRFINGQAGLQLGTGQLSVPKNLGKANFDVGIIAGTKSINLILSTFIPSVDDGKVSVENTKLYGMNDHIEMAVTHPFMMKNDAVIAQVVNYLENGQFAHNEDKEK